MNDTRSCCEADSNEGVSRDDVRNYYSKAAVTAQESLCCPTKYRPEDLAHIPKEVLEISYGCGSPVGSAVIKPGEVMIFRISVLPLRWMSSRTAFRSYPKQ
ncbi:MAG: hypothetical protein IIA62_02695 [Nitrospinae bacterium]|nr:hypothetical protein [Nitrospinota bacterium]